MIALNAIVAKQLKSFKKSVDQRIDKGEKKDEAILRELQTLIKASKKIRFEGNGYGDAWVAEAEKRGLSNLKDTPSAIKIFTEKKNIALFEELGIFSGRELHARQEVEFEAYILKLQIEARVIGDIAQNHLIPAVISYQNRLIENVKGIFDIFGEKEGKSMAKTQMNTIKEISLHLNEMKSLIDVMLEKRKVANKIEDAEKKAIAYRDTVKSYFYDIRYHADKLELLVDDELWPLPKMREILFTR
jgi:glutamine synthetase